MKFILKSGEEITVTKQDNFYEISDKDKRYEFQYYQMHPPVIAGSYVPNELSWVCIIDIICNHIYIREVQDIIPGEDELVSILPTENEVIY